MRKKCTGRVISVVLYEKLVHVKNAFIITKKFFCLEKNLALNLVVTIKPKMFLVLEKGDHALKHQK